MYWKTSLDGLPGVVHCFEVGGDTIAREEARELGWRVGSLPTYLLTIFSIRIRIEFERNSFETVEKMKIEKTTSCAAVCGRGV